MIFLCSSKAEKGMWLTELNQIIDGFLAQQRPQSNESRTLRTSKKLNEKTSTPVLTKSVSMISDKKLADEHTKLLKDISFLEKSDAQIVEDNKELVKRMAHLMKMAERLSEEKEALESAFKENETIEHQILKARDNMEKLLELQERIVDVPKGFAVLNSHREYIRDACLGKVNCHGKEQQRHFFLFNDIMIYTSDSKTTFKFKGFVPLDCCLVNNLPNSEIYDHAFELVRIDGAKKKYIIICNTPYERNIWLDDLTRIIDIHLAQAKMNSINPVRRRKYSDPSTSLPSDFKKLIL